MFLPLTPMRDSYNLQQVQLSGSWAQGQSTVTIFRKKTKKQQLVIALAPHLSVDFNISCWVCNISSKFNFQVAGLKVKVTVTMFRKKKQKTNKLCHHSIPCIYQLILIYLHTFVGMIISGASSTFTALDSRSRLTWLKYFLLCEI